MSGKLVVCYLTKHVGTAVAAYIYCKYSYLPHAKKNVRMYAAPPNQRFDYGDAKRVILFHHKEVTENLMINFPTAEFISANEYLSHIGSVALLEDYERYVVGFLSKNTISHVDIYAATLTESTIRNTMHYLMSKELDLTNLAAIGKQVLTVPDRNCFIYAEEHGHMRNIVTRKQDYGQCWFSQIPQRLNNPIFVQKFLQVHFINCGSVVFYHIEVIDRKVKTAIWIFSLEASIPLLILIEYLDLISDEQVVITPVREYQRFSWALYECPGIPSIIGS